MPRIPNINASPETIPEKGDILVMYGKIKDTGQFLKEG